MLIYFLFLLVVSFPSVPGRRERESYDVKGGWLGEGRSPEELREYEQYEYEYSHHQEDGQYNTHPVQNDKNGIKRRNKLLVIVLDGFRWDYFSMYREKTGGKNLNYFQSFMKNGVRAQYLESVFPAESFPAWQTIQTGLYPETHGIVGNQFYDREVHEITKKKHKGSYYAFFNIEDERTTNHMNWWQKDDVVPIWATAADHNVSFATYLWARCDIPYESVQRLFPSYCENYYSKDLTKTLRINVDLALNRLQMGTDAAIIYEESLAKSAEEFGPSSNQTIDKLAELDLAMGHLEDRLKVTNLKEFVNVIVLSDHGMTHGPQLYHSPFNTEEDINIQTVELSSYLEKKKLRWIVGSGSHAGVYPEAKEYRQELADILKTVPGVRAYTRQEIPEELHYSRSPNSPPILVLANPGTVILASSADVQRPSFRGMTSASGYRLPERLLDQTRMGISGYDPSEPDMRGIFLAQGPAFKSDGEEVGPMKLVDVYQLLAYVLNITPNPHNGTWDSVRGLLLGDPWLPGEPATATYIQSHTLLILILTVVTALAFNSWTVSPLLH